MIRLMATAATVLMLAGMSVVSSPPAACAHSDDGCIPGYFPHPQTTGKTYERDTEGPPASAPATPSVDPEDCGPDARPETGLQGQVPREDQDSGRSKLGYRCGLTLVGQNAITNDQGTSRGQNFQMDWHRDCAYVGMAGQAAQTPLTPDETDHPLRGVAVIDAKNPRNPEVVQFLKSPVGQHQHEGLEVNKKRGMLVLQIGGVAAQWIEIYDIPKGDCAHPRFMGRYDSGQPQYHGMEISADGKTVYATNTLPEAPDVPGRKALHAIDVSDMSNPSLITTWDPSEEAPTEDPPANEYGIHDLDLNSDGTRAYLGTVQRIGAIGPDTPSLVIADTSEVQNRANNPDIGPISETKTANFGHTIRLGHIDKMPHIFLGGELPFVGPQYCPWAWGHAIDVSDEKNPQIVSDIKLEVNELSNCSETGSDFADYSIHFNGLNSRRNTTKVAYAWYTSGLRIFDVSVPANPKEVAYYNPPPKDETVFEPTGGPTDPNHGDPNFPPPGSSFNTETPQWDATTSKIRFRRNGHIWFASIANGFQIVELTPTAQQSDHIRKENFDNGRGADVICSRRSRGIC